jgi:hypothetical protein
MKKQVASGRHRYGLIVKQLVLIKRAQYTTRGEKLKQLAPVLVR